MLINLSHRLKNRKATRDKYRVQFRVLLLDHDLCEKIIACFTSLSLPSLPLSVPLPQMLCGNFSQAPSAYAT